MEECGGASDDLAAAVGGGGAQQTLFWAAVDVDRQSFVAKGHLQHPVLHVPLVFSGQVQFA